MPAWRALLAGLLVLGLGAAVVYVMVTDGGSGGSPVPTLASAPTTPATSQPPPTVAVAVLDPSTTSTTRAPLVTSTSVTPPPVLVAMENALAAWGEFAVTGRMRDLGEYFVSGGPQRRKLREEAETIRADPPGPPAYAVTTADVLTISVTSTDIVLRAEVIWARAGEDTQTYLWDIQMQKAEGVWKLLTVEDVTDSSS